MGFVSLTCLAAAVIWIVVLLLPWRPWLTAEFLDAEPGAPLADLSDITALIPARNEAPTILTTLRALQAQGTGLKIVVVDDCSEDNTARIVRSYAVENLTLIAGEPAPAGWSGKLWALEQGMGQVKTPLLLLLDADIELKPGIVKALKEKMGRDGLHLVSLMAALRMVGFWERLLMPAFVYFFKMLYPFRLSNSTSPHVAAAAGGCILVDTETVRKIGGFDALRGDLIDDCALARLVKSSGRKTWIGLTRSALSLRAYTDLKAIWNMVSRTAFHQLGYSLMLLLACTALMLLLFVVPPLALFFSGGMTAVISGFALFTMAVTYTPTLRFYGLSRAWAVSLPAAAGLYLAMTWTSAVRSWHGKGLEWKGRYYSSGRNRII